MPRRGCAFSFLLFCRRSVCGTRKWTFDAGTPQEQARWIKLIRDTVREIKAVENNEVRAALLALQLLRALAVGVK